MSDKEPAPTGETFTFTVPQGEGTVVLTPGYVGCDVRYQDGHIAPFELPPEATDICFTVYADPVEARDDAAAVGADPATVAAVYMVTLPLGSVGMPTLKLALRDALDTERAEAPPIRVIFFDGTWRDLPETTRVFTTHVSIQASPEETPPPQIEATLEPRGERWNAVSVEGGERRVHAVHTLADYLYDSAKWIYIEVPGETAWRLGRVEPLDRTVRRLWHQLAQRASQ